VTPEAFIEQKARQFVYFINQVLSNAVPYKEIELFAWDILEEWNHLDIDESCEISSYERVFWHAFYVIQSIDEELLTTDQYIRAELNECCLYLEQKSSVAPANCVGVRP